MKYIVSKSEITFEAENLIEKLALLAIHKHIDNFFLQHGKTPILAGLGMSGKDCHLDLEFTNYSVSHEELEKIREKKRLDEEAEGED